MGSHDGIRILRQDPPASVAPSLPAEAKTPAKIQVHLTEGTGMDVLWEDGHRSHWTFQWLRDACPCAMCTDAREEAGLQPGQRKPASVLQLYQDPVRPSQVTPVGRYALQFHWNDGHASGIYSWDFLRRVCRCEKCSSQ